MSVEVEKLLQRQLEEVFKLAQFLKVLLPERVEVGSQESPLVEYYASEPYFELLKDILQALLTYYIINPGLLQRSKIELFKITPFAIAFFGENKNETAYIYALPRSPHTLEIGHVYLIDLPYYDWVEVAYREKLSPDRCVLATEAEVKPFKSIELSEEDKKLILDIASRSELFNTTRELFNYIENFIRKK